MTENIKEVENNIDDDLLLADKKDIEIINKKLDLIIEHICKTNKPEKQELPELQEDKIKIPGLKQLTQGYVNRYRKD